MKPTHLHRSLTRITDKSRCGTSGAQTCGTDAMTLSRRRRDKGTDHLFRHIANAISARKGHWLGDVAPPAAARARNKKMGHTARGAWKQSRPLPRARHRYPAGPSRAGVGDHVRRQVSGNACALSPVTRVVAGSNHAHIYDPWPDPTSDLPEACACSPCRGELAGLQPVVICGRRRVLAVRSRQSVALEVWALLDLDKPQPALRVMTATTEGARRPPWFGGIGTYYPRCGESDDHVAIAPTDPIRIAAPMCARVVGEGANLG